MRSDAQHEVLRLLREELQEAETRLRAASDTVEGLKNAIAQVERLPVNNSDVVPAPPADSESPDNALTTSELVLDIIAESANEWSAPDLHAEMVRRGWKTDAAEPVAAIRASLQRLAGLNKVERASRGTYRRPPESQSQQSNWKVLHGSSLGAL